MAERTDVTRRYFARESALFVGPLPRAVLHAHHALQGCVALEGRCRVQIPGEGPLSTAGALIGADVPHAVSGPGPVAHFYALPESAIGSRLTQRLAGRPVLDLDGGALRRVRRFVRAAITREDGYPKCLNALIRVALRDAPATPRPADPRLSPLLDGLRSGAGDAPLCTLARQAGLSPDRFRHLVREQAGIPVRRYRRWIRLLRAVEALRVTGSVTDAAHAAGFADTAHFSRVFREAFCVPPSRFLRDSRFVQARARKPT